MEFLNLTFLILIIGFWTWTIYDILSVNAKVINHHILWLLIVTIFPLAGSFVYHLLRNKFKGTPRVFKPNFNQ